MATRKEYDMQSLRDGAVYTIISGEATRLMVYGMGRLVDSAHVANFHDVRLAWDHEYDCPAVTVLAKGRPYARFYLIHFDQNDKYVVKVTKTRGLVYVRLEHAED